MLVFDFMTDSFERELRVARAELVQAKQGALLERERVRGLMAELERTRGRMGRLEAALLEIAHAESLVAVGAAPGVARRALDGR